MEDWLIWFLGAIALLVAEMFTAGFWLACLAAGAVVAGIVALIPGLGAATQGIAFAAASLLSMAGLRPRLMHYFQLGPGSDLRTGVDALLGKTAIVTERIGPGTGRVKVDGEDWRGLAVRTRDGTMLGVVVGVFAQGPLAGRLRVHGDYRRWTSWTGGSSKRWRAWWPFGFEPGPPGSWTVRSLPAWPTSWSPGPSIPTGQRRS